MTGLPDAANARLDRRKITEYLLCSSHPRGASKAAFFAHFGFRAEEWQVLAVALLRHAAKQPVIKVVESPYGTRYTVEGPLETPSGRSPCVRSVWILSEETRAPRLISAFPAPEKRDD